MVKPGRKKLDKDIKRNIMTQVKLNKREREVIEKLASQHELKISTYLRKKALGELWTAKRLNNSMEQEKNTSIEYEFRSSTYTFKAY